MENFHYTHLVVRFRTNIINSYSPKTFDTVSLFVRNAQGQIIFISSLSLIDDCTYRCVCVHTACALFVWHEPTLHINFIRLPCAMQRALRVCRTLSLSCPNGINEWCATACHRYKLSLSLSLVIHPSRMRQQTMQTRSRKRSWAQTKKKKNGDSKLFEYYERNVNEWQWHILIIGQTIIIMWYWCTMP